MRHLEFSEILAYVADKMSEEASLAVDTHLAACDDCARRVRAHFKISEQFDELWNKWTAREHAASLGKDTFPLRLPATDKPVLVRLSRLRKEFRGRVSAFLRSLPQRVEAALKVVVDAGRKQAGIVQQGLEVYRTAESTLRFLPISPIIGQTAVLGEEPEADQVSVTVQAQEPAQIEVTVDAEDQTVTVHLTVDERRMKEDAWPLVILVPERGGEVRLAEFVPQGDADSEGSRALLAKFENIQGEHILFFESPGIHAGPKPGKTKRARTQSKKRQVK